MTPVFFLVTALVMASVDSIQALPTADEVVARMIAHDNERQSALYGYTAKRRYVLENEGHHKRAEMVVQLTCRQDGTKQFESISESGWGGARKHVFPRLLEAETEASRPSARDRSRILPENYEFEMVGIRSVDGHPAYEMKLSPKTANKYLMRGRIWIDAEDYAVVRMEGEPAKNPSFWIKSVHFVHTYGKRGPFWFPVSDHSVTNARIFGNTEVRIDYFDYSTGTLARNE